MYFFIGIRCGEFLFLLSQAASHNHNASFGNTSTRQSLDNALQSLSMAIEHIIFDGFGTLVERQQPMPFHAYMKTPSAVSIQWERAMTTPFAWQDWAKSVGCEQDLNNDLSSIALYCDISSTMEMLADAGIECSIMSNLASCFGAPLQKALSAFAVKHWFFSYQDEMKKPDSRYYEYALSAIGLSSTKTLFVGDHAKHDVLGPALSGLNAMRVRREHLSMSDMLRPWC